MKRWDVLKFYGLVDRKFIDLTKDNFRAKIELFKKLEETELNTLFDQLARNVNNLRVVDAAEFLGLLGKTHKNIKHCIKMYIFHVS